MKLTEHFDLLLNLEGKLKKNEQKELTKELIDELLNFPFSIECMEFSELFEHIRPNLIYKNYLAVIHRLKTTLSDERYDLDSKKIYEIIDGMCSLQKHNYNYHYKNILLPKSNNYLELNGRLESWCMRYDDSSFEMINLRNKHSFAKQEYKEEKIKSKEFYDDWKDKEKSLFYLLKFNVNSIIERLTDLEIQLLELKFFENYTGEIFINLEAINDLYKIFIKLGLVKYINFLDFANQMAGKEILCLEKNKGTDKYIAYSINKIGATFIKKESSENWKKIMIHHFDIKDYEKKINPSDDNKSEIHKEIDDIILKGQAVLLN
ncbi:hypothetical protein PG326_10310 [Riemerella anatipestifer]|nr:hypothetical protein [Riemerella anatipestifer]MDY3358710.1 hypothetical protein [Riemerella anatipestifer]